MIFCDGGKICRDFFRKGSREYTITYYLMCIFLHFYGFILKGEMERGFWRCFLKQKMLGFIQLKCTKILKM